MKTLSNSTDIIEVIKKLDQGNIKILSLDGNTGSGKSYLAKEICSATKIVHLSLDDDYLIKQKATYVDHIIYDKLDQDIQKHLKNGKQILLDGICILKILDNLKINSGLKIYVKRLASYGFWHDSDNFDYSRNVDDILNENEESLQKFMEMEAQIEGKPPPKYEYHESIFHEIVRYHHQYNPDLNSDIIYERYENAG